MKKHLLARSKKSIDQNLQFHSMAIFRMTINVCNPCSRSSGVFGKIILLLGIMTYRGLSPRLLDRSACIKNSNKLRESGVGGKEYISQILTWHWSFQPNYREHNSALIGSAILVLHSSTPIWRPKLSAKRKKNFATKIMCCTTERSILAI